MMSVIEGADGLRQDRVGGDKPDHHAGLVRGHHIHDGLNGGAGHKGFAAAGGHLHADMGDAGDRVVIRGHAAETDVYILGVPVMLPRGKDVVIGVQHGQVRLDVKDRFSLIAVQFHLAASLQFGYIAGNLLEGDMAVGQFLVAEHTQVGVHHIASGFALYCGKKIAV